GQASIWCSGDCWLDSTDWEGLYSLQESNGAKGDVRFTQMEWPPLFESRRRSRSNSPPNSSISGPLIEETLLNQRLSLPLNYWWVP
ncbi:hypothetical protein LINPERPRIM_LOCUS3800, partial [Linum perenne]